MTERRTGYDETRRCYDRISRAYDFIADSSEHVIRDRGIQALGLSRGQRVLEIGCGTGHGLVGLAQVVGPAGQAHGIDISPGMLSVARARIASAGQRNLTVTVGDARYLCFRSGVFDAAFMSFTLELFGSTIPQVLAEVRRVLRAGGRVGIVAMAEAGKASTMTDLYEWLHRHWPHVIACRPIDVMAALDAAGFQGEAAGATAIWTLPVVAAIGVKPTVSESGTPRA
jgi:ubiquinone/menaquinone biosynthesis C-methylase UbiE